MPKGKAELRRLEEERQSLAKQSEAAARAYRDAQNTYRLAESLETAIGRWVRDATQQHTAQIASTLRSTPWSEWVAYLGQVSAPTGAQLAGICLRRAGLNAAISLLGIRITPETLAQAIEQIEPGPNWPSDLPGLEVVDGRSCGEPFHQLCVHFASIEPTAP